MRQVRRLLSDSDCFDLHNRIFINHGVISMSRNIKKWCEAFIMSLIIFLISNPLIAQSKLNTSDGVKKTKTMNTTTKTSTSIKKELVDEFEIVRNHDQAQIKLIEKKDSEEIKNTKQALNDEPISLQNTLNQPSKTPKQTQTVNTNQKQSNKK